MLKSNLYNDLTALVDFLPSRARPESHSKNFEQLGTEVFGLVFGSLALRFKGKKI